MYADLVLSSFSFYCVLTFGNLYDRRMVGAVYGSPSPGVRH